MLMIHMLNYAPDVIKDMNIKLFNIMSRINETGHVSWLATRKCK